MQGKNNHSKKLNEFEMICGINSEKNLGNKKPFTMKEEIAYNISTRSQYELNRSKYWQENTKMLPLLTSLVKRFCIIPATSVPSESAFSIANFIQRNERSSLSAETLKYSIILRDKGIIEKLIMIS